MMDGVCFKTITQHFTSVVVKANMFCKKGNKEHTKELKKAGLVLLSLFMYNTCIR